MLYHTHCWVPFKEGGMQGREFYFINLDEGQLVARIVSRWEQGRGITWGGETVESLKVDRIRVFETEDALPTLDSLGGNRSEIYRLMSDGTNVTDIWIKGPAGDASHAPTPSVAGAVAISLLRDTKRVMVVHGRNLAVRDAMFTFLRSLGLSPIEWDQAVSETGSGSPHNLDAVRAAMDIGQAVVVILTAEDQGGLLPDLAPSTNGEVDDDVLLRGQPRQNVILEAGLAMGVDRLRTILVEVGPIRRASDFEGLNVVRLSNSAPTRGSLRSRLRDAGCAIDETTGDWMRKESGGEFEVSIVDWKPREP